uniref:Protein DETOXIFICATION n=1 Tax=Oryza brachyantha TaxID=4533 RepID=J3MYB3_ORYBR
MALSVSGWLVTVLQLAYVVGCGCPVSRDVERVLPAGVCGFVGFCQAINLIWRYGMFGDLVLQDRILILLTGHLKNSELAVNVLSGKSCMSKPCLCFTSLPLNAYERVYLTSVTTSPLNSMSFQAWEMMIPVGFLAGTGVHVANELGAGNGKGARFATIVSTATSFLIGLFFTVLALSFHDKIAIIFSSSKAVIDAVDYISVLLAVTILLNGVQPVLSGVAIGSGWQAIVAYVNIGCYYFIGVPIGVLRLGGVSTLEFL